MVGYPCRSNNEEVEEEFVSLKQSKIFANGNNLSGQVQFMLLLLVVVDDVNGKCKG